MQELCSKQGTTDYNSHLREQSLSILELLNAFPSCSPPLSILIGTCFNATLSSNITEYYKYVFCSILSLHHIINQHLMSDISLEASEKTIFATFRYLAQI